MAAAAEILQTQSGPEVYASSLRAIRGLGRIAIHEQVPNFEYGVVQEAWRDFVSATEENLSTDPDYGNQLRFEPFRSYGYINGHVTDKSGQRIIGLVERGYEASRQAAQFNPEMAIQAERDEGDVMTARIVDSLRIGEMYAVVSMEPKEALRRNPKFWRDNMHYREGMAVAQVYYRSSNGEVLAGAYSIKESNKEALRRIFAGYGVHIPANESENRWIRHGIRMQASLIAAEGFGKDLAAAHRRELGQTSMTLSVTELLAKHESLLKNYFYNYLVPLAQSYGTRQKHPKIEGLAQAMLKNGSTYSHEEAKSLMRLGNGMAPNDEDVRFMEEKIRYSLVEELRKLIPKYLSSRTGSSLKILPAIEPESYTHYGQMMLEQMAQNISAGQSAGRTYGGCSGAGKDNRPNENEPGAPSQGVFGGKGDTELLPDDKFGSRYFKCPLGHENVRRERNKLIDRCQHTGCNAKVSCK